MFAINTINAVAINAANAVATVMVKGIVALPKSLKRLMHSLHLRAEALQLWLEQRFDRSARDRDCSVYRPVCVPVVRVDVRPTTARITTGGVGGERARLSLLSIG